MLGRGSPKLLSQAMQRRKSPKVASSRKHGGSPKEKVRAARNSMLEKTLVDLLHEHNTPEYRGQNGWSTDCWNKIVREFHERENYVSFSKGQIQEKEKELKREYRILKDARKQSGASWNERRCMIIAEPAVWDNIIISYPKAKKFRNKSFPLFEALGELYDGHTAKENYNFTSAQPAPYTDLTQVDSENEVAAIIPNLQSEGQEANAIVQPSEEGETARVEAPSVQAASRKGDEKGPKRQRKSGNIEGLMERYLDMRTKQAEDDPAQLVKEKEISQGNDFSIKKCISALNTMELTKVEKAKAYGVFKNPDNREIFLTACDEDQESALIWLRNEMD